MSQQQAIALTESIGDWLDGNTVAGRDGAEDDYYVTLTPAYRSANAPMASVSELRAVAHMTPDIYRALRPWVTVWPREPGTLNIHTAPPAVLRSINADDDLSPLSESEVQMLLAQRSESGFADVEDFLASPVFAERQADMQGIRALLGEQSCCFLLDATVKVAERNLHLYSVLERRQRSVRALARSTGSL